MKLPHPIVTPETDKIWRLVAAYSIISTGLRIDIEEGFYFDGASIPRLLWRVVGHPMQGLALPASLVHDALYASHLATRETADAIFLDLLARNGVPWLRRRAMYRAVRMFGRLPYERRTTAEVIEARDFVEKRKADA